MNTMPTLAMTAKRPTIYIDGGEPLPGNVSMRSEAMVENVLGSIPDPNWTATDSRGHFHARAEDGTLPTLKNQPEHVECDGACGEPGGCGGYTVPHWLCRICGEEMHPGRIDGPRTVSVGERRSWEVDVPTMIEARGEVSVRIVFEGATLFGRARITSQSTSRTYLVGVGPLSKAGG